VPPDRIAASSVVVVGPDQELQALAAERKVGRELVDGTVTTFGSPQSCGIHAQLDHDRLTIDPVTVEILCRRSGVSQRGIADDDAGAGLPGLGWPVTREKRDASA
jgi:hypothetical protein